MEVTESYRVFLRPGLANGQNLKETLEVSGQVREILRSPKVKDSIAEVHKFGASSHNVQKSILEQTLIFYTFYPIFLFIIFLNYTIF